MTKQIFLLAALLSGGLLSGGLLTAQTVEDALRYSFLQPQGTARFVATGGSMSALGVDFSTASVNPAGIGWVRNGYVVVSPGVSLNRTNSLLLDGTNNSTVNGSRNRFALPNVGVVFTNSTRSLYWPTFNIGIGINRQANFNETINYRGRSIGSLLESFVEDANDGIFNDFRNELAFDPDVQALFSDDAGTGFLSDYDEFNFATDGTILREGSVIRQGSLNEFVINFGGSFKDKVMWGFTLGVPFTNFTETREYAEIDRDAEVDFFDDLSFDELLEVSGTGLNFKFGLILRPSQTIRVGISAHSPTFWSFNEVYETDFTYNFTELDGSAQGGTALSPRSEFGYNLQTPWRFVLGTGIILGKKGFVSFDVDYTNFAANQFGYDDFAEEATDLNNEIDEVFTSGLHLRAGGEYRINDAFQIRVGAGLQNLPFQAIDETYLTLSGGFGYRAGRFFLDLAYQFRQRNQIFQPYSTFEIPGQQIDVDFNERNLILSAGLFF